MDMFHNKELLTIIQKHHKKLDIQFNVGIATTMLIGDLPGYGTVSWYNANEIANINKATESLMIAWNIYNADYWYSRHKETLVKYDHPN